MTQMTNVNKETMEAAVDAYMKALNESDLDGIMALYADNATVEDPVGSDPYVGSEAVRTFYMQATSMDIDADRTGPGRAAGNEIAFPFTIAIKSTDAPMLIRVIDVFKFNDDGKVVSMRAFWGPENCEPLS